MEGSTKKISNSKCSQSRKKNHHFKRCQGQEPIEMARGIEFRAPGDRASLGFGKKIKLTVKS